MSGHYNQSMLFEFELRKVAWQQISAYLRCPLEYRYRVSSQGNTFDPRGPRIEEGRILHKLMREFLNESPPDRSRSWITERISTWGKQHPGAYWSQVRQTVEEASLCFFHPILMGLTILELEKSVERPYKDFLLSGRLDCLGKYDGELMLIDFKLDRSELEHLADPVDRFLQLAFYAYCLQLEGQLESGSVEFIYFFLSRGTVERHKADISTIVRGLRRIEDLVHKLDTAKEWPPRKNALCGTCGVRCKRLCPLWERR